LNLIKDKHFIKTILAIGVPIALQQLIGFLINTADTVMLSRASASDELVSAANLANNPFFLLMITIFGLGGGGITLAAQYWGKGDVAAIRKITAMILHCGLLLSFLFGTAVLLFPERIMTLFTNDAEAITMGAEYLRIVGWSYYVFGFFSLLASMLRSVEVVKISLFCDIMSLVLNVFLNWVFIFGNLGAPALGIKGAAIATLTARSTGFLIMVTYVFIFDKKLKFRIKNLFMFDKALFADIVKYGFPVMFNEMMWALAITIQAAIVGHIDYADGNLVAANAANGIVFQLCLIMTLGVSNSALVIMGKTVGAGDLKEARKKADAFFIMGLVIGAFNTAVILLLRNVAPLAFDLSPETLALARRLLVYVAIVTFFATVATMSICGIFRGGGDTRFCFVLEVAAMWGVAIPLAFILAFAVKPHVEFVYLGMKIDEVIKTIVCVIRVRGNGWIKTLTR